MPSLRLAGAVPDLVLLVVIAISLLRGGRSALVWALAGGLLLGMLSGGPLLTLALSLICVSVIVGVAHANLPHETPWLPIAAAALGTFVNQSVGWAILQVSGHPSPWFSSLLLVMLPTMMIHILMIYPVYWVMRRALGNPAS